MASIIKLKLDVSKIPADKIYHGKKGKYVTLVATINNEVDNYGNQGPVTIDQSKEEKDSGAAKVYLGNNTVVWTDGQNVDKTPYQQNGGAPASTQAQAAPVMDDLPF